MSPQAVEAVGWLSAGILLLTLARQVYVQWRSGSVSGLSRWLFVGQMAASFGFVAYSYLVANWVFVVTNLLLLLTAALGQWLYLRNKQVASSRVGPRPDNR
jgi:hypothetical protein